MLSIYSKVSLHKTDTTIVNCNERAELIKASYVYEEVVIDSEVNVRNHYK